MLAVVKTPHTKITLEGEIPKPVLRVMKFEFGKDFVIKKEDNESEWTNPESMDWYKKTKAEMTPGLYVKTYRESRGWSQQELGAKLGGLTRQRVSNLENDHRSISKNIAKQLAELFDVPIDLFL